MPLHLWRKAGSYLVSHCNKTSITIEVAAQEIGAALLSDAEHLLDHASEHRASLHQLISEASWCSPAWSVVTAYYWAFFSGLAITRIVGRSVWFLDRTAVSEFRTLASATDQPGAGALSLSVGPQVTMTSRSVTLRPTKSQMHDAVWAKVHALTVDVCNAVNQDGNPDEYRFWWCLAELGKRLGPDWASKVRNAVNYRPGFGYREVISDSQIEIGRLRRLDSFTSGLFLDEIEGSVLHLPLRGGLGDNLGLDTKLLMLYATALCVVSSQLHADVIGRQQCDPRWQKLRGRFIVQHCSSESGALWPFSASL